MLINGIELSSLGVELYDRVVYSNDIDTKQEWLDGDIQPTFIRQQDRFKNLKLDFLVLCAEEDEAFTRISRLTAMLKKATVKFDDLNFTFDVSITSVNEPTRLKNGNFIVSYLLTSGYAKGQREVYTTNANMTNSFKLTLAYYKDKTTLLSNETVVIRASAFDKPDVSLQDLGIDPNKYLPKYYNEGIVSNLGGADLTYENLQTLQVLIINYEPITYNINVKYFMDNGEGFYNELLTRIVSFTQPGLKNYRTIGQLIDINEYRPSGYKSKTDYTDELTVEKLLLASMISVFYDKVEVERSKNIIVAYRKETDDGSFEDITSSFFVVGETQFYDGLTLKDLINVGAHLPDETYYNSGYIQNHDLDELITFDSVETGYVVEYTKKENVIYIEYYVGTYPNWRRLSTVNITTKQKDSFITDFDVVRDLNIDLNKYHTAPYKDGILYNKENYNTYDNVINAGVLQVFYVPIDYTIMVNYYTGDLQTTPVAEEIKINATMFFDNPVLNDIIPIQQHRPDGYQFSTQMSYAGEVSLEALTQASPILIVYEEIAVVKTKNIIIKYKKELSSAYSTLATNLITISEADCAGGVRLKDLINMNAYKPEYYEDGILDGASSNALVYYDNINSSYDVMYLAKTYTTSVRYYLDGIDDNHWIGSASLAYRVIDFTTETTLYDFGLSLNTYKPANASDGELQYKGPVNFTSLVDLPSIDILYITQIAPPDPDETDYPHRFLFLQHNDLGEYEHLHPEWTLNHAFINTGITADDMSKLTVVMECQRVDAHVPLHEVNGPKGYLFGSSSGIGQFFMRFNNQTMYGENLTGVNLYEAKAGKNSNLLTLTEENAIGFSENTGIYSSPQVGYSRAVFTYSNVLATDGAQMPYPLYLFANNDNGSYNDGIAGIGIYSCRIYYNDKLVRDMIPVSFYDKIGDLVAPSNCLYDKITNSFFEDGTGLNSFNIRDDDRFEDPNPEHKLGHCYVNYYKEDQLLTTMMVWFRGNDFGKGKEFDLYEKFLVDKNQPQYTYPGKIINEESIDVSFDGLNNKTFKVVYDPVKTHIEVNYYKEDSEGTQTLLQTEVIPLREKDFYQAPTFGDLVRLNKYKPDGYETDFKYTGRKVSLARVVEGSPYSIIYKPMAEAPQEKTTVIVYKKKVFGVRTYEVIKTEVLTFDQSDFRDGEYIDFYIDKNKYKPEKYYLDGTTYRWYEMDERLDKPEDLKSEYVIVYQPERQFININYYTDDETDEANIIATDTWSLFVDDLDPRLEYSLIDLLPNKYINKYKPVICSGGRIIGTEILYKFDTLMALPFIQIVYDTIHEPDDPEEAYYEPKVLGFGTFNERIFDVHRLGSGKGDFIGGYIPYIDLGYRPKEIGRLKVEVKGMGEADTIRSQTCGGGFQDLAYNKWFGYEIPRPPSTLGLDKGSKNPETILDEMYSTVDYPWKRGHFSIGTYIASAGGWVYTAEGPQSIDGQLFFRAGDAPGVIHGAPKQRFYGNDASFQRGASSVLDENYSPIECYKTYRRLDKLEFRNAHGQQIVPWVENPVRSFGSGDCPQLANPITTIMDAYNNYYCCYTNENSNHPDYTFYKNEDKDIFEARLQPRGTLSLFQSTNPLTGKPNIMPFRIITAPNASGFPNALTSKYNPYTGSMAEIENDIIVQTGTDQQGNPIYEHRIETKNIEYANFPVDVYPQLRACAVWNIKIWDRDRLIRDMIPVSKGQKVFNYEMPENGLFDLITEIFFGNNNEGGFYTTDDYYSLEGGSLNKAHYSVEIKPEEVLPLWVKPDPGYYGLIVQNYYDFDYTFLDNSYINVPTWYSKYNTTIEEILGYNDYKPNQFYLDGLLDLGDDADSPIDPLTLKDIYDMGSTNILYKLRTFSKTVVYYRDNYRVGSRDILYSIEDIKKASTLADLGIDPDLYYNKDFQHGRIVFDETILSGNDIQAFIDAPSPIVIYDKLSANDAPNLFYVEYYRGGAYDDNLITTDPTNPNYLDCDLTGIVLNPNGAIKYLNHYHSALYEDEIFDYFIPYQVKLLNKYIGIHRGPARRFPTLAVIPTKDVYTIIEERNGWGRLKEYPVGWILLRATEPITGPGQNPNYDIPGEGTPVIKFKTEVHITKLTVDRLWCYIPELESWVKSEDISYNQSGKLYNALGLDVIHLDKIDFATANSLDKMGIYPNKYAMFFHDRNTYKYEGEYTKEAFQQLHELDFVYPETVYHYTCIYYKDSVYDGGKIEKWIPGRGKANGTGYYFYRTSSADSADRHPKNILDGESFDILRPHFANVDGKELLPIKYDGKEGYISYVPDKLIVEKEPAYQEIITAPSNEVGRASFSCSIGDWNPDWDVFISTSWKNDASGVSIVPNLYRDTELALPWSYFGFDKNLYRPAGSPEGIYLWNPRTWKPNGDIDFTFKELIRTGTQYVLYPCIQPNLFKIKVEDNIVERYEGSSSRITRNPGFAIDLGYGNYEEFKDCLKDPDRVMDITAEVEIPRPFDGSGQRIKMLMGYIWNDDRYDEQTLTSYQVGWHRTTGSSDWNYTTIQPGFEWKAKSLPQKSFVLNISNLRESPTTVIGVGSPYEGKHYQYYLHNPYNKDQPLIPINDSTNLKGYNNLQEDYLQNKLTDSAGHYYYEPYPDNNISNPGLSLGQAYRSTHMSGIIYGAQSYEAFMMRHWWIPVPKGMWYKFNGEKLRIPENGLFDLITGEFSWGYNRNIITSPLGGFYNRFQQWVPYTQIADGKNLIYLRNERPYGTQYDYFNQWHFNSQDINYAVKTSGTVSTYKKPDTYAVPAEKLPGGLVVPVSKSTADSENNVVGEWYYSCGYWFASNNASIHAGMNKSRLTKLQQNITLVQGPKSSPYYVYLDPDAVSEPGSSSSASYAGGVEKVVYYNYVNNKGQKYYFDGAYWIPWDYTSLNTVELNKNYAVIPTKLAYYSQPIMDDKYIINYYHYGDRITVPYVCQKDREWGYTGLGWIRVNSSTVSEVI